MCPTNVTDASHKQQRNPAGTAIFTVVSNNYLHFARTLLKSVRAVHPAADLFCVIVDRDLKHATALADEFTVIRLDELDLPDGESFYFQYNVLELNTAVKPWAFEALLKRNYGKVIYIDPDIRLYRSMNEVVDGLDEGNDIIITPHLLSPMVDDKKPSELDIRRAGTYNFGFCAVRNTANSMNFVKWWQSKLTRECIVAFERGIFVDQSWIDLVPGLFENVKILRHPGYNVAYWNLAQRDVVERGGKWTVNGEPLVFFHYSGLDPANPGPFSKHQDRFSLDTLGPARKLIKSYVKELQTNGFKEYSKIPYGFDRFDDGPSVPTFFRSFYRENDQLRSALGAEPFSRSGVMIETGKTVDGEDVSWAMLALWKFRVDLQVAFPLGTGESVRNFRGWFAHEGRNYYPDAVVDYHRDLVLGAVRDAAALGVAAQADKVDQSLNDPTPEGLESSPPMQEPREATVAGEQADQAYRVQAVFHAILGRHAEPQAVEVYQAMLSRPTGRLRLWRAIANSRESRKKPKWISRSWKGLRIAMSDLPTFNVEMPTVAGERAEPEVCAVPQAWYEPRIAALRNNVAPFWLYTGEPSSHAAGYWTNSTIQLPLPVEAAGETLRIEGWYHGANVRMQTGAAENHLAVFLRHQLIDMEVLSDTGDFTFECALPDDLGSRPYLTILSEKYFVPSDIGQSADGRELALRLKKVTVGGRAIFDCAQDNPLTYTDKETASPPGINLIGYIKAELGIGEAARSLAAAARSVGIPYSVVDVGFQTSNRQTDESAMTAAVGERQPIDLLHVNADQAANTQSHLRRIDHEARVRIGFWAWEQPVLPDRYLGSFLGLDEVWVPTSFVQEAVSVLSPVPVFKLPHAVHFDVPAKPNRARFGLPSRAFLALVMYDFYSYHYRKNPDAAIAAFRRGAKNNKSAALVIKTLNAKKAPEEFEKLQQAVADLPNVIFINEFLTREDVYELQACCDVLLSLHRAEGFGLAPAEMMFLSKPVIATGWSGNMDFMTPMNSFPVDYELKPLAKTVGAYEAGQLWAEADIDHAGWCLRELLEDPAKVKDIGARASADVRRILSPNAVGQQMRDRLNLLADRFGIA